MTLAQTLEYVKEFIIFFIDMNHCAVMNSTRAAFNFYKTNRENLLHTQYTKNNSFFFRTENVTLSVRLALNHKSVYCSIFSLLFAAGFKWASYLFNLIFTFYLFIGLLPKN